MFSRKAKIHGLAATYGLATHARDIWKEHPALRTATEKAVERFGYLSLDGGNNVLVGLAIRDGVKAHNEAVRLESKNSPAIHYYRAFYERLSDVLDWRIIAGEECWQPLKANLNDLVGELHIEPAKKRWNHQVMTPIKAILLSFMDEEASEVIIGIKPLGSKASKSS